MGIEKTAGQVSFILDDTVHVVDFSRTSGLKPSTTLLNYLRKQAGHTDVREGCAEGDCGACTVVLASPGPSDRLEYRSVNACLVFLPMVHGKQVITASNLAAEEPGGMSLHPVQQSLLDHHGVQCGFCTPGMIMSMFALYKQSSRPDRQSIRESLAGNLCRCTGYRPVLDACLEVCAKPLPDRFTAREAEILELLLQMKGDLEGLRLTAGGQTYLLPFTLKEALALAEKHPSALLISGGTDVAVRQNRETEHFPLLIDLSQVNELKLFVEDHSAWYIGSGISLEELKDIAATRIPSLYQVLRTFASAQIRHLATLGGNLASASPIGDTLPWLMVMEAGIHLLSAGKGRTLSVHDFITGYRRTALQAGEIISMVSIPKPKAGEKIAWIKVSNRHDVDIASVSAAIRASVSDGTITDIRIAMGGIAATPLSMRKTQEWLTGRPFRLTVLQEADRILQQEFTPISDARSDARARRIAAGNILVKWYELYNYI